MKIDILQAPPTDIFQKRPRLIFVFVALLFVASCGILFGVYAIFFNTAYYEQFETLALVLFIVPAPFATYFGEKLQGYKKLMPPQREELTALEQKFPEIKNYCDKVRKDDRRFIRSEYEACLEWAEDQGVEIKKKSKKKSKKKK